jgi:hypothetical protein
VKLLAFCEAAADFRVLSGLVDRTLRDFGPLWVVDLLDTRTKEFAAVTLARFRELARRVGQSPDASEALVADTIARIAVAWATLRDNAAVTNEYRAALRRHWQKVPLLQPHASQI